MSKVTIRDIAERLKIGKTTVALALMDKYGVSEETKSKVFVTACEMGYDFSKVNKKRSNKNKTIKLVLRDKSLLTSDFWTQIIQGVEMEGRKNNIPIEVFAFDSTSQMNEWHIDTLKDTSSGVIFVDGNVTNEYRIYSEMGIPVVLLDPRGYEERKMTQVNSSNYIGGMLACKHLWRKGHRKLCICGNAQYGKSLSMRCWGFINKFNQINDGTGQITELTLPDPNFPNYMHNNDSIEEMFKSGNIPTGVFCCNDLVARRFIAVAKEFGFSCPDDISVVGYDDSSYATGEEPLLTTIEVKKEEIGRLAVRTLLGEIDEPSRAKQSIEVIGTLVERESVKDVNK
jgi:DNA-binding LacI/PurR family transcriptional regulator